MGFDYSKLNEPDQLQGKSKSYQNKKRKRKSSKKSPDTSDSESDCGNDSQPTKELSTESLASQLAELVRTKFEPQSCIAFEHLIKIEKELWPQDTDKKNTENLTFIEFIQHNRFLFEQLGIRMSLIGENSEFKTFSAAKNRDHVLEQARQLISSFKNSLNEGRKCMEFVERAICLYYNVSNFADLKIGNKQFFKLNKFILYQTLDPKETWVLGLD
jgi:hypothetical protein